MLKTRYIFLILFLVLTVTFFTRNNLKGARDIAPEVLGQPKQYQINSPKTIKFIKNSYSYEVTPLYDYEVSGLIVSKINYKLFSIEKFDKVFPYDVCLIWGSNVSRGIYRDNSLRFSQDCRWCYVQWSRDVNFNWEEFANNHLLINNPDLEGKVRLLAAGDQVKIKGQLINVKATLVGKPGSFDSLGYTWNSGVGKSGLGAGACKVIYVKDVEVLKKANVVSSFLFHVSLYGLLILMAWRVVYFFIF